ncbi:DEAD-box ATP-dependent RNA helicase [Apophysomyces ossiformis]|uniref:DEAD-box ATP-dependent RNA helicase n=1 Tax=Apophysomyces ossiformis TaxID=679940 RepID=A0A8H7C0Z3_9FUNG|nr:DEAD-box ATP-dependent RNA helicase [Apophysomyces ossiformis]
MSKEPSTLPQLISFMDNEWNRRGRGRGRGRGGPRGAGGANSAWSNLQQSRQGPSNNRGRGRRPFNAGLSTGHDGWRSSSSNGDQAGWADTASNNYENSNTWGNTASNVSNTSWDQQATTSNNSQNASWGIENINQDTASDNGWAGQATWTSKPSNTTKTEVAQAIDNGGGWDAVQETTEKLDSWNITTSETGGTSGGWNPAAAGGKWFEELQKGDSGEERRKEDGRGYWEDGVHHLAERSEKMELKLFGTADDKDFQHTGINFEKYADIPVETKGKDVPNAIAQFSGPSIDEHLLSNIELARYTTPTPVQKYSIPIVAAGRDLMACAQTGKLRDTANEVK